MTRDTDDDWRKLAEQNPYHAVLTDDKWKEEIDSAQRIEFMNTGANYIREVLAAARKLGEVSRGYALDFGCGVGRLVANMAPHADFVVGLDVSPRMVEEANQNLALMKVENARIEVANDLSAHNLDYSWINSYIVFQHIPQQRGYAILKQMLDRLLPGGLLSVHFTVATDATLIGKKLHGIKYVVADGRHVRFLENSRATDDREAVMSMHDYDLNKLLLMLAEGGISRSIIRHTNHKGHHGALIVGVKKV